MTSRGPQALASAAPVPAAPAAVQADPAEEEGDDLFASPPGLWLPRMVVKQHRKKATVIWILLLIGFLAYVSYIVWETLQSRKDPASSIELKQEYYKFPDVAVCPSYLQGCLEPDVACARDLGAFGFFGFTDNSTNFMKDHKTEVEGIESEYNGYCKVFPLSRATPNYTGIENGDILYFSASFFMLWEEGLEHEFTEIDLNNQYVPLYFIDIDQDLEAIGNSTVDAKVPYARINLTTDIPYVATVNHMVMGLTEFTGINANGDKKEKQRTFSQSTTTAPQNWRWTEEDYFDQSYAFLVVEMSIRKFEFTSIEEVDPVDAWSILGAIGGIWQFVVTGFGLFFVFSVKQAPDRKMRNFKKSMAKPAVIVNRRLSSISARNSNADIEVDASEEDLPMEWVKKRRPNGSLYYFNVLTGAKQAGSPNDLDPTAGGGAPDAGASASSRGRAMRRIFQPAHDNSTSGSRSRRPSAGADNDPLPPGWIARADGNGKPYYMDTISKTTQWDRPTQRVHSTGGPGPQVVDTPMMRRRSNASSSVLSGHHSSSSGAAAAAFPTSPPDAHAAPPPPLGSTLTAPSYRTAVFLSNSSATAAAAASGGGGTGGAHLQRAHQEKVLRAPAETFPASARAPASSVSSSGEAAPAAGAAAAGVHGEAHLPPNWHERFTSENRPYYVNLVTKTTQWKVPQS